MCLIFLQCSRTCGEGLRLRYVGCFSLKYSRVLNDESACDMTLRPPSAEACKIRECADWHTGDWGEVRVTITELHT